MPDLGKYAFAVLGSYVAGLALLLGLVALTVLRARRMARRLDEAERDAKTRKETRHAEG